MSLVHDSPWLVGWRAIGDWIGMHPRTVAKVARIRRVVSFIDRRPRITRTALDAVVGKATK